MKKRIWILFATMLVLMVACSNENEKSSVETEKEKPEKSTEVEKEESEDENVDVEEEIEAEDETDSSKTVETGENLFSKDLVFDYQEGDVNMTLDVAEFTEEFATKTGEDVYTKNSSDIEILFHVKGSIFNDSLDIFSYGHSLGAVQFKLIYDDKHEFELLGTSETVDGSKFEGATIYSLQEQIIHLSTNVPIAVSESDKSLVLVIFDSDGEHEEVLR